MNTKGEVTVSESTHRWREQDSVIYFSVTSTGTTGPEWEEWFDENGYELSPEARFLLNSPDFKPTNGVTTEIAVLNGLLFKESNRVTGEICAEAERRSLTKPNAEVACLIRKYLSNDEIGTMGFWWVTTMHEPIKDSGNYPCLLFACRRTHNASFYAYYDRPNSLWNPDNGFAFAVSSRVSP